MKWNLLVLLGPAKSLLLQTLRAALIGVAIGATFGLLTALGSWGAERIVAPQDSPTANCIAGALYIVSFPGMITQLPVPNGECTEVALPRNVIVGALYNALFWAALVALLLAWPGPVFALWLTLISSWGLLEDTLILKRRWTRAGRSKRESHA